MSELFSIRLTCPFCENKERMMVALPPLRMYEIRNGKPVATSDANSAGVAATAAICPECETPFGIRILAGRRALIGHILAQRNVDDIDNALSDEKVITFPQNTGDVKRIEELPMTIQRQFVFIQEDALRKRNAAGILSGSRACLDVALKELGQTKGGRRERISKLADQGIITHKIAEWAQKLWEDGSDAVHDLTASMENATDHVEFLKLFFEVAFVLPARIEAASHGQVSSSEDAAEASEKLQSDS